MQVKKAWLIEPLFFIPQWKLTVGLENVSVGGCYPSFWWKGMQACPGCTTALLTLRR